MAGFFALWKQKKSVDNAIAFIDKKDRWVNDLEVVQYLRFYLPITELAGEKWLEKISFSEKDVIFVVDAIVDGVVKPIGTCGLHGISTKDRNATFGISIGNKDFRNGGYGTEATRLIVRYGFEQLNLHRINSTVYDFNESILKMHRNCGFKEEGRQREAAFKNNHYVDVIILGLLKKEWR